MVANSNECNALAASHKSLMINFSHSVRCYLADVSYLQGKFGKSKIQNNLKLGIILE